MQCPSCGAPVVPGGAFCESCGADLRGAAQPAVPLAPQPYPPQASQPYPAPGYQQPAYGQPAYPPSAPRKRSSGAIIAIVIAVVLVVAALGVGGLFLARGMLSGGDPPTGTGPATATVNPAQPATPTAEPGGTDDYVVVTDAEARQVVIAFMEARLAQNVAASKQYCTQSFLEGEWKEAIDDKYWRPDSYTITKLTSDQMYIHVTTIGIWPSGEEPTIYSVYREPTSNKVLIDGILDYEMFPELVTP